MAGKPKTSKPHRSSTTPGKKTVGVYDRPPQKRPRQKLLLAVVIALALLFSLIFLVRFTQGSTLQGPGWEGMMGAVTVCGEVSGEGLNRNVER
jgi:hypothetical protein